ncbi:hypothetical protein C8R44DRAFT_872498 [Mycena epipterygia]|nr:hypothetical protein C8R44DRAFT_872498 [Mycena epipterygia]
MPIPCRPFSTTAWWPNTGMACPICEKLPLQSCHFIALEHIGLDLVREIEEITLLPGPFHTETIAMIAIGLYTIKPLDQYLHIGLILGGCYSLKVPRLFTFFAVPSFVACGVTLLTLGPGRAPVIALFLRDGVFWFLALVLVCIVEIVLWDKARRTLAQIPVVPATGLIAVIAARVVLNIKNIASNPGGDAVSMITTTELNHMPARRALAQQHVPWYLKSTDTTDCWADTLVYSEHH